MTPKPNKEYWALKAKIDKWGVWLSLAFPVFLAFPLIVICAIIVARIQIQLWPLGALLGFASAGFLLSYLLKKKIGYWYESEEKCQNCGVSIGRMGGFPMLDFWCRICGNDNSVDLHDS